MSPIIFISYSAKDNALAGAIHAFLNRSGVRALKAPEDIVPGTNWAAAITEMIETCTHMVLVWTSNSMASQEVSKELTLAMQCGAVIIPFRSEDLAPEGAWRYHLSQVQWLEAHGMPEGQALEALLKQVAASASSKTSVGSAPILEVTQPSGIPASETRVLSDSASLETFQGDHTYVRRKKLIAAFLALFLGGFGAHKFYLGRAMQGCIYLGLWVMTVVILAAYGSKPDAPANEADGIAGLLIMLLSGIAFAESITYFVRNVEDFERINLKGKRAWF